MFLKIDLKPLQDINHNPLQKNMSTANKSSMIINYEAWNTSANRYMQPKINDKGGKSVNIISTVTNRSPHITTPMLMTWGPSDFVGDNGESDGKFSMALNFPNPEYANKATDTFLQKFIEFEETMIKEVTKNSELWMGQDMSEAIVKHMFFPSLKYPKNKDTKKVDMTRPPSIRVKLPNYRGKWAVEIYDTKSNLIFPCENDEMSPVDFIPKLSYVACVIQCGGFWFGGKGWGLTWKLVQCVVKPQEVLSVIGSGKCHIQLSSEDTTVIEKQSVVEEEDDDVPIVTSPPVKSSLVAETLTTTTSTMVEDSDEEDEATLPTPPPLARTHSYEPEPVGELDSEEYQEPVKEVAKKVVKKVEEPATVPPPATQVPVPAKKVVKKKVATA